MVKGIGAFLFSENGEALTNIGYVDALDTEERKRYRGNKSAIISALKSSPNTKKDGDVMVIKDKYKFIQKSRKVTSGLRPASKEEVKQAVKEEKKVKFVPKEKPVVPEVPVEKPVEPTPIRPPGRPFSEMSLKDLMPRY